MVRDRGTDTDELDAMKRRSLIDVALSLNNFSADVFKWTLGALLVVNGGGIVAILNSADLREAAFNTSGLMFGGGLFSAILAGFCWTFGLASSAMDQLRRAWDPAPLEEDDFEKLTPKATTTRWVGVAMIFFVLSMILFAAGCIAMSVVPSEITMDKASQQYADAGERYVAAVNAYVALRDNPKASRADVRAALDRVNSLRVEERILGKRAFRALGENENEIDNQSAR